MVLQSFGSIPFSPIFAGGKPESSRTLTGITESRKHSYPAPRRYFYLTLNYHSELCYPCLQIRVNAVKKGNTSLCSPGPEKSGILEHKCMLNKRVELFLPSLILRSLLPIYQNQDYFLPQVLPRLPATPRTLTLPKSEPLTGSSQSFHGASACSEVPPTWPHPPLTGWAPPLGAPAVGIRRPCDPNSLESLDPTFAGAAAWWMPHMAPRTHSFGCLWHQAFPEQ